MRIEILLYKLMENYLKLKYYVCESLYATVR